MREALIRLSAEGLVQNLRNRTSIVAPFDVATLPAYFDATLLLYRLSARLAAANITPPQVEGLWRIVHDHEDALHRGDMKSMVRFNHDFHTAIAEISGNPFLANWMSGLLDQGQRLLRLYARNQGDKVPDSVLKPHRDMVEAIAAGDADKAEAAGRADAEALMDEYKRNLSNRPAALLLLESTRRGSPAGETESPAYSAPACLRPVVFVSWAILRGMIIGYGDQGCGVQLNQRPIIAWSCGG